MDKSLLILTGLVLPSILFSACATAPIPTPTPLPPPTATIAPTSKVTPTETLTPTITPTRPPTLTSTPIATNTLVPTVTPVLSPARRLRSGDLVFEVTKSPVFVGAYGRLTVINSLNLDAVIILQKTSGSVGAKSAVYVRSAESFTKDGVSEDSYSVYLMIGEDWDSTALTFTRELELRYLGGATWRTTDSVSTKTFTIYTITLSPSNKGNEVSSGFPTLR